MSASQPPIEKPTRPPSPSWLQQALGRYRPLPGVHDEMMQPDGTLRDPWRAFFREVGALGPQQLTEAFASAHRHLKDSGVYYRVYDDPVGAERAWPLAPMPLLVSGAEWAALKAG